MNLYDQRGVSSQKEDVHRAIRGLDKGLYPNAFCKIFPDILGGDDQWVNLAHADGAGTKAVIAYLYWKETGDLSVWKGIAQDAIVMNLDDLLCVGIYNNILFSSTIDRNKNYIPGEILEAVISGTQEFFDQMKGFGINIHYMGGETADVGDVVKTISVNGTMTARWKRAALVTNEKIRPGDLIIGLSSSGQCNYESGYNSGIGSNGLTSARHDLLHKTYGARFHESYDTSLDEHVVYIGPHRITDEVSIESEQPATSNQQPATNNQQPATSNQQPATSNQQQATSNQTIGKLLLSPTRTFAPVIKTLLENNFEAVHGLIHCSGGGQTKCLKYVPENTRIVKDNLFEPPLIFQLIQESSKADDREMYSVFNMGTRMEIYTGEKNADAVMAAAKSFGVEAQVIGRVEPAEKKELIIKTKAGSVQFTQ
jgi:phosphoribosylformylglycinamidine cyclo-ligase